MKHNITYKDEPMGRLEVIPDFLPPPEALAIRDERVDEHARHQKQETQ